MNDRGLAVRLRAYEITSKNMRIGETVCKGYAKCDFEDAWKRYLPVPQPPATSSTSATSATSHKNNGHDISHGERVELMMKHNGMTREQAEAEAAKWAG